MSEDAVVPAPPSLSGLVGFLPVGYPDERTFIENVRAAFAAGVGALELGIALSTPSLDGPRVAAAFEAVTIDPEQQLELLGTAAGLGPVVAVLFAAGVGDRDLRRTVLDLEDANVQALFIPDLTVEQQLEVARWSSVPVGLFVGAERDLSVVAADEGSPPAFVYLRSSDRATGEALDAEEAMSRLDVTRDRLPAGVPLLIGFGVQHPDEVAALFAAGVDAVVVGSAVVAAAEHGPGAVAEKVRELLAGVGR